MIIVVILNLFLFPSLFHILSFIVALGIAFIVMLELD